MSNRLLRALVLVSLVSLCLGTVSLAAQDEEKAPKDPKAKRGNVVLIVVDDQGLDAGCYGNRVVQTPALDRLAADGTRFDFAFCTTASCSASRSVILTGLHNHRNGQYGHQHSYHDFHTHEILPGGPRLLSLPVLLSRSGYRTARIGKFHVQPEEIYAFDVALGGNPGGSRNPVAMAERCRSFIAETKEPFFLYFCTSDPHRSGGKRADRPGPPDRFGNRPEARQYAGVEKHEMDPAKVIVPPFLPDTPECRAELAEYYESVNRVDQGLGRLVEILRETGKYDDTLILYLSDNGIAFPGAKTNLYEPGMRLPLVVRAPGQKRRGGATDAMVTWADLTPTILEFAGALPADYAFHGRSFLSALDEPSPEGWDRVFASHTFHEVTMYYPMRVVRERRFKYILNLASGLPFPFASDLWEASTWQETIRSGRERYGKRTVDAYIHRARHELYDLENDPDEIHNLADDPEYASVLARLQAEIQSFQERTGDPWKYKWKYE